MARLWALAAALVGAIILAIAATTPPTPRPANAPAGAFSAGRAMEDVRIIAARPHPTGSSANDNVRDFLVRRLTTMGLQVTVDSAPLSEAAQDRLSYWAKSEMPPTRLTNVIAVLPGADSSKPALALMAHYDSVWDSPGASDDAAGVATILETVRALQVSGGLQRDLIVLITDAEELGLQGAAHFFANHPMKDRIGTIINMEARGGGGRTTMFEMSLGNGDAMRLFQDSVKRPATSSLGVFVYRLLPNDTDLTPALAGPYTAYNFAFIGRPGLYHSPLITPERLDQGSLQDMGDQVLDLSRALLEQDELPGKTPDLAFFDLFGLMTIAYAPALGWAMLGLGALAYVGALWGRLDRGAFIAGTGRWLAVVATGGALLFLGNLLSGADGPVQYYDRLAAIPRLEAMALLGCLAAALLVLRKGGGGASDWAGFALPLFAGALAAQAYAPTAAYVLVVPVMLAGASALAIARLGNLAGTAIAAVLAALVTGYMIALGHQLMQGVGPELPMTAIVPLTLALTALMPLMPRIPSRGALLASGAMVAAMAGIALWVRLDPIAETAAAFARFS